MISAVSSVWQICSVISAAWVAEAECFAVRKESTKEYIVKEEFKNIEQKYSNDKLDILLRLLKIKFEYLDEIYIKKIKILSDKAIDKIIDDIFNINNIDELNKYFK